MTTNPPHQAYSNQPSFIPPHASTQQTTDASHHQSDSASIPVREKDAGITLSEEPSSDPDRDFIFEEMEIQADVHQNQAAQDQQPQDTWFPEANNYNNNFAYDDTTVDYCNKYTVGQFNVNGWFSHKNPYSNIFKLNVLECLNASIVVLCETHCHNEDIICIDNYTIYQHNRKNLVEGRRGSGGIAICIKNSLLFSHEVLGIFKNRDGIIGIKLRHRFTEYTIGIMGNYLSPSNYHYGRDAEGYYNNCSVLWETLSDCDLRIGTGDYNSRTNQVMDYLPDIDGGLIPQRINPDHFKNSHGDSFISCLKDNRTIILNGRITPEYNNFTFVTPRGGLST